MLYVHTCKDVHFTALECGNKKLADMAKKKAEAVSSGDLLAGEYIRTCTYVPACTHTLHYVLQWNLS